MNPSMLKSRKSDTFSSFDINPSLSLKEATHFKSNLDPDLVSETLSKSQKVSTPLRCKTLFSGRTERPGRISELFNQSESPCKSPKFRKQKNIVLKPGTQQIDSIIHQNCKYLLTHRIPCIRTDTSQVEFGICLEDWERVVFKTISNHELATREFNIFEKVRLKNIPKIPLPLDTFLNENGDYVFVFNRLKSLNIRSRDLEYITSVMYQLFTTLEPIHQNDIIHLDINPFNMMTSLENESDTMLIDFGLAHDTSTTDKLPLRGTPGFIAPEILSNSHYDSKVDIYSAGVMLGMMLVEFFPTINLRLLGSPNITLDDIAEIITKLEELFSLVGYTPEEIVKQKPSSEIHSDSEKSYQHESSPHGSYHNIDDDYISSYYSNSSEVSRLCSSEFEEAEKFSHSLGSRPSLLGSQSKNGLFFFGPTSKSISTYRNIFTELESLIPKSVIHAADLLRICLCENPDLRPSASEALKHPLFSTMNQNLLAPKDSKRKNLSSTNLKNISLLPKIKVNSISIDSDSDSFFKNTKNCELYLWVDKAVDQLLSKLSNENSSRIDDYYHLHSWE
ncbi:hypothetical protein BB560_000350 [Smittium megazygosporum]|uniref:Protein kinase domain-containing protein n=1 Tax=Smittium megazygosporum TaxID=133381 RepID=A0A2T9ZKM8_9FUNG|nr:hypothetical protein BB560_000350 [Smittium megazygosporum]